MSCDDRSASVSDPDRTPVAELGAVTKALLAIARDGVDDRELAMRICRACVDGLDVDGAAISLLTGSVARQTLAATDATAELLEDLQFTLSEGACMEAARTGSPVLVPDLRQQQRGRPLAGVRRRGDGAQPGAGGIRDAAAMGRGQPGGARPVPPRSPERWMTTNCAMRSAPPTTAALMMLGLRTEPDHGGAGLARSRRCPSRRDPPGDRDGVGTTGHQRARRRWPGCGPTRSCTTGYSYDVARDVVARRLAFTENME